MGGRKKTWASLITKVQHSRCSALSFQPKVHALWSMNFREALQYCERTTYPLKQRHALASWGELLDSESHLCKWDPSAGPWCPLLSHWDATWAAAIHALTAPLRVLLAGTPALGSCIALHPRPWHGILMLSPLVYFSKKKIRKPSHRGEVQASVGRPAPYLKALSVLVMYVVVSYPKERA